jgi:hypothetical protein
MTLWRYFLSIAAESGRWCRRCGETIGRADQFGRSEGVCGPCRRAAA